MIVMGIFIMGEINMDAYIEAVLQMSICFVSQRLTLAIKPTMLLMLNFELSGGIPHVAKGGISVDIQLVTFSLIPMVGFSIKQGLNSGFKAVLVYFNPKVTISVFVDTIWIKFCGVGPFPVPCGITMKRHLDYPLTEFYIIPDSPVSWEMTLIEASSGQPDRNFPETRNLSSSLLLLASAPRFCSSLFCSSLL